MRKFYDRYKMNTSEQVQGMLLQLITYPCNKLYIHLLCTSEEVQSLNYYDFFKKKVKCYYPTTVLFYLAQDVRHSTTKGSFFRQNINTLISSLIAGLLLFLYSCSTIHILLRNIQKLPNTNVTFVSVSNQAHKFIFLAQVSQTYRPYLSC